MAKPKEWIELVTVGISITFIYIVLNLIFFSTIIGVAILTFIINSIMALGIIYLLDKQKVEQIKLVYKKWLMILFALVAFFNTLMCNQNEKALTEKHKDVLGTVDLAYLKTIETTNNNHTENMKTMQFNHAESMQTMYSIMHSIIGSGEKKVDLFKAGLLKNKNVGCILKEPAIKNDYYIIGNANYLAGLFRGAIDNYNIAIELIQKKSPTYIEDFDSSKIDFSQCMSILYLNLGFAYNADGDKQEGIDALEKSIKYKPLYARAAYLTLGKVHSEIGDFVKADNVLKKAINQGSEDWKSNTLTYEVMSEVYFNWAIEKGNPAKLKELKLLINKNIQDESKKAGLLNDIDNMILNFGQYIEGERK